MGPLAAGRRVRLTRPGRRPAARRIRAAGTEVVGAGDGDAELEAAVALCRELLREAAEMAEQQTRAELMRASRTDGAELGGGGQGDVDAEEAARVLLRVQAVLMGELGMPDFAAQRLSAELLRDDSPFLDAALLESKLARLAAALPGCNIGRMLRNHPAVLNVDVADAVHRLLALVEALGASKAPQAVEDVPRLILVDNLKDRVEKSIEALLALCPREGRDGALVALCEEPVLLLDLPDLDCNWKTTDIAELPIDVQNAITYAVRDAKRM